ncbi:MAG: hypothetical protein U0324_25905 [Polyangiales bacterium]
MNPDPRTLAPVPDWLSMPFYYASLTCFRVYYRVARERLARALAGTETRPADLGGDAFVSLDFQRYTAHLPSLLATTSEVELNALVVPDALADRAASIPLADLLAGRDETRTVGYYRLHVPCDNAFAVKAGVALFGERKYEAAFSAELPSPNGPAVRAWRYACDTPSGARLYALDAAVGDAPFALDDRASIVRYSTLDGRLVGSRWELSGEVCTWAGDAPGVAVSLAVGDADHALCRDLRALVGDAKPAAIQAFTSRPAAVEGRGFFVSP